MKHWYDYRSKACALVEEVHEGTYLARRQADRLIIYWLYACSCMHAWAYIPSLELIFFFCQLVLKKACRSALSFFAMSDSGSENQKT